MKKFPFAAPKRTHTNSLAVEAFLGEVLKLLPCTPTSGDDSHVSRFSRFIARKNLHETSKFDAFRLFNHLINFRLVRRDSEKPAEQIVPFVVQLAVSSMLFLLLLLSFGASIC
jgi:hypothetical protein